MSCLGFGLYTAHIKGPWKVFREKEFHVFWRLRIVLAGDTCWPLGTLQPSTGCDFREEEMKQLLNTV